MFLYVKGLFEAKYQHLIKNHEDNGLKILKDPKASIEYSNNMQDIEECNPINCI